MTSFGFKKLMYLHVPAVFSKICTLQSHILAEQLQGNWLKQKTHPLKQKIVLLPVLLVPLEYIKCRLCFYLRNSS